MSGFRGGGAVRFMDEKASIAMCVCMCAHVRVFFFCTYVHVHDSVCIRLFTFILLMQERKCTSLCVQMRA